MNQTLTGPGTVQVIHLKDATVRIGLGLGLIGNAFGLMVTCHMKVGFPITRLLFRLQFVWDALGCSVLASYRITYQVEFSYETITENAFVYLWTSFCLFDLQNNLSAINVVMLAFDQF